MWRDSPTRSVLAATFTRGARDDQKGFTERARLREQTEVAPHFGARAPAAIHLINERSASANRNPMADDPIRHPEADALRKVDPEIFDVIQAEEKRQRENIEFIASENFTSRAVMEAQGAA